MVLTDFPCFKFWEPPVTRMSKSFFLEIFIKKRNFFGKLCVYIDEGGDKLREKEILRKLKKGETTYIEYVVTTYYSEIYMYLCRKLGNEIEAQDVTQEVFAKFFANLHAYKEMGKLRNYLFKLATNASNDIFRKNRPTISLEEAGDILDTQISPTESIEKKEDAERVKLALQSLPMQQREVIILRFYHELSFLEIARITDSNLSTAKTRYRRGMESLKRILEVEYEA